jgi:hypothetical protein
LRLSPRGQAQHRSKVLGQRVEAACRQPTLRLLVDGRPGRQVFGIQCQGAPVFTT